MQRSNKPTLELTAMTIIDGLGPAVRATGYSNGLIVLTNINEENRNPSKNHDVHIGEKYHPEGSPAVTAMASVVDGNEATLIAGHSNASLRIMKVSLGKNDVPKKHDGSIKLAQPTEKCPVLSITILDDKSVAIILANGKIKVINFEPNLQKCKSDKKVSLDKAITPAPLPTTPPIMAAAILKHQLPHNQSAYVIYVLNAAKQLVEYTYDRNFKQAPNPRIIPGDVAKIATPATNSSNLIYAKTDGTIWKTSLLTPNLQQIRTHDTNKPAADIYAMASSNSSLHIAITDNKFAIIPLNTNDTPHATKPTQTHPTQEGDLINFDESPPKLPPSAVGAPRYEFMPTSLSASAAPLPTTPLDSAMQRQHSFTAPSQSGAPANPPTQPTNYTPIPAPATQYTSLPMPAAAALQTRVPRIITTNRNYRFLMHSKASIASTGASGAKLVLCKMLRNDNSVKTFAVVKKLNTEGDIVKELGGTDDRISTMTGTMRNYGWQEVTARHGGHETTQTKWYLFLEHMNQGDGRQLRDFFHTNNVADINTRCLILQPFAADLLSGLKEGFRDQHKYHLDIKPENFMLKYKVNNSSPHNYTLADLTSRRLEAKLVDFGESIAAPSGQISHGRGDSRYMSPQRLALYRVLNDQRSKPQEGDLNRKFYYGAAEDAWALGVTFLELLLGYNPFVYGVYEGREKFAGMDFQLLTTCNFDFFNRKITELNEQFIWFANPETSGLTGTSAIFVRLIKNLVSIDESRRTSALLSGATAYSRMPDPTAAGRRPPQRQDTVYTKGWPPATAASAHPPVQRQSTAASFDDILAELEAPDPGGTSEGGNPDSTDLGKNNPFL